MAGPEKNKFKSWFWTKWPILLVKKIAQVSAQLLRENQSFHKKKLFALILQYEKHDLYIGTIKIYIKKFNFAKNWQNIFKYLNVFPSSIHYQSLSLLASCGFFVALLQIWFMQDFFVCDRKFFKVLINQTKRNYRLFKI